LLAVGLSLIASLSWGTADFLGGLAARRRALLAVMVLSQASGLVALLVFALPLAGELPSLADLVPAIAAGVVGVVALSLLYLALATGTMSVVAPIAALGAVVPVLVSLAGGDALSVGIAAGIVLALGGAAASAAAAPEPAAERGGGRARSIWLAIAAAVGLGSGLVLFDAAGDSGALWAVLVARAVAVAVVLAALAVRPAPLGLREPGIGQVALLGVLDAAALTLFTLASNEGVLAVVSVLSSLYPVVTVVLARVVLGERMRRVQVTGIAVAFVGIALIASSS
jgi:drug/metabolite transporter (DMT)-like permease